MAYLKNSQNRDKNTEVQNHQQDFYQRVSLAYRFINTAHNSRCDCHLNHKDHTVGKVLVHLLYLEHAARFPVHVDDLPEYQIENTRCNQE